MTLEMPGHSFFYFPRCLYGKSENWSLVSRADHFSPALVFLVTLSFSPGLNYLNYAVPECMRMF